MERYPFTRFAEFCASDTLIIEPKHNKEDIHTKELRNKIAVLERKNRELRGRLAKQ